MHQFDWLNTFWISKYFFPSLKKVGEANAPECKGLGVGLRWRHPNLTSRNRDRYLTKADVHRINRWTHHLRGTGFLARFRQENCSSRSGEGLGRTTQLRVGYGSGFLDAGCLRREKAGPRLGRPVELIPHGGGFEGRWGGGLTVFHGGVKWHTGMAQHFLSNKIRQMLTEQ